MRSLTLYRVLAIINLALTIVLITDTFIARPTRIEAIYDSYFHEQSYQSQNASKVYFINTTNGDKFSVPSYFPGTLHRGDTIYINKSRFLKQPVQIIYHDDEGQYYSLNIGFINTNLLVKAGICFILVISFLNLFPKRIIRNTNQNETFIFLSSMMLLMVIYFYFTW